MDYQAYLHSGVWKARSAEAIRKAKYRCAQCGNIGRLQCHHLTYTRLGNELSSDIVVLCDKCHRAKKVKNE